MRFRSTLPSQGTPSRCLSESMSRSRWLSTGQTGTQEPHITHSSVKRATCGAISSEMVARLRSAILTRAESGTGQARIQRSQPMHISISKRTSSSVSGTRSGRCSMPTTRGFFEETDFDVCISASLVLLADTPLRGHEVDGRIADADTIAVRQQVGIVDSGLVDEDAVAAAQVMDIEAAGARDHFRALTRDQHVGQHNIGFAVTSNQQPLPAMQEKESRPPPGENNEGRAVREFRHFARRQRSGRARQEQRAVGGEDELAQRRGSVAACRRVIEARLHLVQFRPPWPAWLIMSCRAGGAQLEDKRGNFPETYLVILPENVRAARFQPRSVEKRPVDAAEIVQNILTVGIADFGMAAREGRVVD